MIFKIEFNIMAHIFKFSDAATIALHTMVMLAYKANELVCTHEIASSFNISEAHLSKVLQRLSKTGWIHPVRGPKGGFKLAVGPETISLLDIYELFDGRISVDQCLLDSYICGGKNCILGKLLHDMNEQAKKYLEDTTLDKICSMCEQLPSLQTSRYQNKTTSKE